MNAAPRLFFHLRSPYSWLAVERLMEEDIPVDAYPMAGIPSSMTSQGGNPDRLSYIGEDVTRIAKAHGLSVAWPKPFDCEWVRPCAAFLYVKETIAGGGDPATREALVFLHALYRARFMRGQDLGQAEIVAQAAGALSLDAGAVAAAMDDPLYQTKVEAAAVLAREAKVCGVPFFTYAGQRFWGQDRIDWLKRAMGETD